MVKGAKRKATKAKTKKESKKPKKGIFFPILLTMKRPTSTPPPSVSNEIREGGGGDCPGTAPQSRDSNCTAYLQYDKVHTM